MNLPITVDASRCVAGFQNFWNGSGMSYSYREMPSYDVPVVHANMALIGAIPHDGCIWQRPHLLLKLIRVEGFETGSPRFDFATFDSVLDSIVGSGQKLWFELMGIPAGAEEGLKDFTDAATLARWQLVVATTARRLLDRYGQDEVRSWVFECWNEPDHPASTIRIWRREEVIPYYQACAAGLAEVDPALRLGGPGTAGDIEAPLYQDFLTLGLTQPDGFRLDYLSYHHKTTPAAQRELAAKARDQARAISPRAAALSIVNNEADADLGWNRDLAHRARPGYAAYIARQVVEFQLGLRAGETVNAVGDPAFRLANDNAFIGKWNHRTQFAWFGGLERFALVKKPAHNVMTLLALQGNEQVAVSGADLESPVGVVAARRGEEEVTVLLCRYDDHLVLHPDEPMSPTPEVVDVDVKLTGLPFATGTVTHYRIDDQHGDSHARWRAMGSPEDLTAEQLAYLRASHELTTFGERSLLNAPEVSLRISLPLPAVHLVVVRAHRREALPAPTGLKATVYPGLHDGREDVLLHWRADRRGVSTYRVEKAMAADGPWEFVAAPELVAGSLVVSVPAGERAWYRVRAADDAGRLGDASAAVRA